MALGLTGEGGFISQPLAIVVIGGLVSSTLLTLVLVPTLYTMVENRKEKSRAKRELRRRRRAAAVSSAGETPKHAVNEPDAPVPPDAAVPDTSGGAHEAPEREEPDTPRTVPVAASVAAEPSTALRGYTDQFEVLKMPRRRSTPPA
jgi:HAE1 family hydrophobic/amphiphilic exporter-1